MSQRKGERIKVIRNNESSQIKFCYNNDKKFKT